MSRPDRIAAVSVDLDEIACYTSIHGLPTRSGEQARVIYAKALPRLLELFDELQIRATFFVIASDLSEANSAILREAHARGHELANHSLHHLYDLTRQPPATIRAEIADAGQAIHAATGAEVVGFRAPGYTITDTVFEALTELGYRYDSSVFPCPSYFAAKAAAIGLYKARAIFGTKQASKSIVDDPRVLAAPADPYRVGAPYWRCGQGILELPIGVTSGLRLPYIGTSVVLAGARGARVLSKQMLGRPFINLELHGIDLADAQLDGLQDLAEYQPDLRRSMADKRAALKAAIETLKDRGAQWMTLAEAASYF